MVRMHCSCPIKFAYKGLGKLRTQCSIHGHMGPPLPNGASKIAIDAIHGLNTRLGAWSLPDRVWQPSLILLAMAWALLALVSLMHLQGSCRCRLAAIDHILVHVVAVLADNVKFPTPSLAP